MVDFISEVQGRRRHSDTGARLWSTAYHGSGILSILCSSAVAFLAAFEREQIWAGHTAVLAALLSALAAALTGIGTFAGFSRKWRANRATRTALDELIIDLSAPDQDMAAMRERYKEIRRRHDRAIAGEDG